jgi:hypothetical protein
MAESGAAPAPMEGAGAYNRASGVQAAGLSPALPLFRDAAGAVPLAPAPEPVVIVDYGASEGRNSLEPIRTAIAVLRERAGMRAISVVHTDLPDNDFAALFAVVAENPGSYMRGTADVFPSVIGRSFYGQILPSASVTLGWSSWAVQWLSRVPAPIPDQLQVAFSHDATARAAYAAQAEADWRRFLAARAAELRPGGRLVLVTMARDDAGDFGYEPCLAAMYATRQELVAEGLVRGEEAARMAIPTVGRSRAELLAPFEGPDRVAWLAAETAEVFLGEDRIWRDFDADRDAAAYGRRWTDFCRASVFPTLAAAIGGPDAAARRAAFFARMAEGMARRLAADPQPMKIPLARMTILRRDTGAT